MHLGAHRCCCCHCCHRCRHRRCCCCRHRRCCTRPMHTAAAITALGCGRRRCCCCSAQTGAACARCWPLRAAPCRPLRAAGPDWRVWWRTSAGCGEQECVRGMG